MGIRWKSKKKKKKKLFIKISHEADFFILHLFINQLELVLYLIGCELLIDINHIWIFIIIVRLKIQFSQVLDQLGFFGTLSIVLNGEYAYNHNVQHGN